MKFSETHYPRGMLKRLADLTAWLHFSWVILGIASLPLLFLVSWWNKAVLIYALVNILDWAFEKTCFLLQIEFYFRRLHEPRGSFEGRGFMEHYLKEIFNVSISRSTIIRMQRIYLGIIVVIALIQIF